MNNKPFQKKFDNVDQIVNLIRNDYNVAITQASRGNIIYRGNRKESKLFLIKPSSWRRKSSNTTNIYNTLIDILPSWKNWPKRSQSIICSTEFSGANGYGNVHLVLPKNGAKIGVCRADDFWSSFPLIFRRVGIGDMDDFNWVLGDIFHKVLGIDTSEKRIEDWFGDIEFIISCMKKMEKVDKNEAINKLNNVTYDLFISDMIKNWKSTFLNYIDELMNPVKNEMKLITIEKLSTEDYNENEVWTDADSILYNGESRTSSETIDNFIQKLQKLI